MWTEIAWALLAIGAVEAAVTGLYWLVTGLSPWPLLVLGELLGSAMGVFITLAIFPPRRS